MYSEGEDGRPISRRKACARTRRVCLSLGFCIDFVRLGNRRIRRRPTTRYDNARGADIYILKLVNFPRRPSIDRTPSPPKDNFLHPRQLFAFFRAREAHDGARVRDEHGGGEGERAFRSKISSD